MQEEVKLLGLSGLGNIALLALSIRGHLQQGHINSGLNYLYKNIKTLKRYPDFSNIFTEYEFKPPYANITPFDILHALNHNKVISYSPDQIFNEMQRQIEEVYDFALKSIDYVSNPDKYKGQSIKFVEKDGKTPLFGLEDLLNYEFNQPDQAKAFLTCFGWGLGKMDSFEHRFKTLLPYGGGVNVPLNLTRLPKGEKELWHDVVTLSQIHLPEELGIEQPGEIEELMEIFNSQILKPLQDIGLIQNKSVQGPNLLDGYVRILRGQGSADFMSYIFSWIIYGHYGWIGMRIADFWDTAEQISSKLVFGGQDNQKYEKLMKYQLFKELMELNLPLSLQLSKWSYENPSSRFQPIESCSERYFLQENNGAKGPFNTIIIQYNFLKKLPEQFNAGSVEKKIPQFPIGFGKASSRGYFDYVIQKLHEFYEQDLIPPWAFFAQNLNKNYIN